MSQATPTDVRVGPDGAELDALAASLHGPRRGLLGLTGPPGVGKSTLAAVLAGRLNTQRSGAAVVVPLDGFHLADAELVRVGLADRKGAAETFDARGYAELLHRLRSLPSHVVYAPAFDRVLEQPVAGAIAVSPATGVVITEGNYLLLDAPPWRRARGALDEVWYLHASPRRRVERLLARHVAFGKQPAAARAWVREVDEPNARLVEGTRKRADRCLDLTDWRRP